MSSYLNTLTSIANFVKENPKTVTIGIILFLAFIIGLMVLGYIKTDSVTKNLEKYNLIKPSGKHVVEASNEETKIGGMEKQLETIYKQIQVPRNVCPELCKRIGVRNVKGIIFYGPPGTGKTMLARNLANRLGCATVNKISASSLLNKYFGETERKIREAFEHPKGKLHMVVFDEIETICPVRTGEGSEAKILNGVTNQLLAMMDGLDSDPDVIVVGTTNNLKHIDPAILRPGRFDLKIEVSLPGKEDREKIFNVYTENLMRDNLMEPFDMDRIVSLSEGYSGADIENSVRESVTKALYRHVEEKSNFYLLEDDLVEVMKKNNKRGSEPFSLDKFDCTWLPDKFGEEETQE